MRSNGWLWVLAIAMLAALAWGLEEVAFAPLQTGEVYPAFSSLRADPMGAKALYESLAALPGITVERLYKQRQKLENSNDVMFVLGVDPLAWSAVEASTLAQYVRLVEDGGRLVIAFLPTRTPGVLPSKKRAVESLWGVKLQYRPGMDDYSAGGIPHDSALYFDAGDRWDELEVDESGAAVAVESAFGKGTIVLAADTYPLSNEGLREARDADLIIALTGQARRITFDENHFGVVETGSVTQLMRRYRLQGAIAVLIVVAALFLWRSASSLLPPRESGDALVSAKGAVAGRDSLDGMAALLHRGVPEKQLLDTCFTEWSKTATRDSRAATVQAAVKNELARQGAAPVDAYRAACEILTRKT